jgi:hypothetical protein
LPVCHFYDCWSSVAMLTHFGFGHRRHGLENARDPNNARVGSQLRPQTSLDGPIRLI